MKRNKQVCANNIDYTCPRPHCKGVLCCNNRFVYCLDCEFETEESQTCPENPDRMCCEAPICNLHLRENNIDELFDCVE